MAALTKLSLTGNPSANFTESNAIDIIITHIKTIFNFTAKTHQVLLDYVFFQRTKSFVFTAKSHVVNAGVVVFHTLTSFIFNAKNHTISVGDSIFGKMRNMGTKIKVNVKVGRIF